MDTEKAPLWLALLLVAGLVVAPGARQGEVTPAARPAVSTVAAADAAGSGAEALLRTVREARQEGPYVFRYLIFTVPDPDATFLGYALDTWLEALQRAAETAGYMYDRHWLPWRGAGDTAQARREPPETPGLILFRGGSAAAPEYLLVFVVGETASGGLNRAMFQRAVRSVREVAESFETPEPGLLRVVGPTFSGSMPSLRSAIRSLRLENGGLRFHVVTGSATNVGVDALDSLVADKESDSFERMIENDGAVEQVFLDYLDRNYRIPKRSTAMLSEAGTAFGLGFVQSGRAGAAPNKFTFPMELARLRQAYQRDPELSALWSGRTKESGRQGLDLPIKPAGAATDRIPTYSVDVTALSQEMILSQIAGEINRREVMAAGINATDTLDTVFVGRLLQQRCPDVRLFTFNPDVLFLHRTPNLSFFGMLLVGSYSLLGENPAWWTQPGEAARQHLFFANQTTQATYNASLRQIAALRGEQATAASLQGYSDPFRPGARQPPVWVTVVGRDGLWPVAVLRPASDKSRLTKVETQVETPASLEPRAARLWHLCYWLAAAWSFWSLRRLWRQYVGRRPANLPMRRGDPVSFYLMVDICAKLAIFVVFAAPYLTRAIAMGTADVSPGDSRARVLREMLKAATEHLAVLSAWLLLVMLAAAAIWVLLDAVAAGRRQSWRERWLALPQWGLLAAMLAVTISFTFAWAHFFEWRSVGGAVDEVALFFTVRATHPSSGVSPVFPLAALLLAVVAWSGVHLRLLRYGEFSPRTIPAPKDAEPLFAGIRQQMERLRDQQAAVYRPGEYAVTGVLLVFAVVLVQPLDSFRSLEGPSYNALCVALLSLGAGLLILAALRLLAVWSSLAALLRRLKWHPLRESYARIPREFASHPMWGMDHRQIHLRGLLTSAGILRRAAGRTCLDRTVIEQVEADVRPLLEADGWAAPPDLDALQHTNERLDRCAAALMEGPLAIAWRLDAATLARAGIDPEAVKAAEDLVAIRISAFLRRALVYARHLLRYLGAGFVLMLFAIHAYPFQPHRTLVLCMSVLFLFLAAAALFVLVQMERNPVISWMSGSKPGKLDFAFLVRVGTLGAMPLLTIAGAQFPEFGRAIFAWVDPLLQVLR